MYERRLCLMFARSDWVFPLKNVRSIYSGAKKNFIRIKFPLFFVNSMKLRAFCWFFHIFFSINRLHKIFLCAWHDLRTKTFFWLIYSGRKVVFYSSHSLRFYWPKQTTQKHTFFNFDQRKKPKKFTLHLVCVCATFSFLSFFLSLRINSNFVFIDQLWLLRILLYLTASIIFVSKLPKYYLIKKYFFRTLAYIEQYTWGIWPSFSWRAEISNSPPNIWSKGIFIGLKKEAAAHRWCCADDARRLSGKLAKIWIR